MAAVVIEIATGNILALVSIPTFDLNRIRDDYKTIVFDSNEPLRNRAIKQDYPPGSTIKPFVLIAALESKKITSTEVISCPAGKAPKGWPNCWINRKYPYLGHDDKWMDRGGNKARNAIRGSCNIYFSRLTHRIDSSCLQQWLWKFGYGREILPGPFWEQNSELMLKLPDKAKRNFQQYAGVIYSGRRRPLSRLEEFPAIENSHRKYFGIGQGDLRATPLQVANAMAAISRDGLYKDPVLFTTPSEKSAYDTIDLNISPETLTVVRDGMYAVVNELDGTAFAPFQYSRFDQQDVKVYGKTGSTEGVENAWFAGFAEDSTARGISIVVVVEGGQHGSSDAGPLARDIIQFCIDAGYIGKTTPANN